MSILKSIKGLFGQTIHYENGVKVGETWDGLVPGTKNHYNSDGSYAGSSAKGFFADEVHYDKNGRYVGESWKGAFGATHHYGSNGIRGTSYDGFTGTTSVFDDSHPSDAYKPRSVFEKPESIFEKPKSIFDDSDNDSFDFGDPDW